MRHNIINRISLTRLLIVNYVLLLVFLFVSGYQEYRGGENSGLHGNTASFWSMVLLLLVFALTIAIAIRQISRTDKAPGQTRDAYRALFDLSPLPGYFVDTNNMKFVEVNPAAVRKYGFSRSEFLKMTIGDLRRLEGEEKDRLRSWVSSFIRDFSYEASATHYKKNGRPVDVALRVKAVELMNRKLLLVIAIDLASKERREREINRAILKAQENERREIGTELHDNICQILASSQLLLDLAGRYGSSESMKFIERSKKNIRHALHEIRSLSHRLAPIFIEVGSFRSAINELLFNMNPGNRYAIDFDFDQGITPELIPPEVQLHLYRILQEQLKNIVNYANASNIKLGLSLSRDVIRMYIMDDGVGFDPVKVKKGMGLINMQRRVELFSGKFSIETSPGCGCRVSVELPVPVDGSGKN